MKKAFSLLELIIIVLILTIIISLFIPKLTDIFKQNNLSILKSQLVLIRTAINTYKTKEILLGENGSINSLDEALINKENEELFSKVIKKKILSSSSSEKKETFWIKESAFVYSFILSKNEKIKFKLKDGFFECISDKNLCLKVE